jgi:hypothetical protein
MEIRGSDEFKEQTAEAIEELPPEYESLVRCWLRYILERGRATSRDGVFTRTGMFYGSYEPELGPKANAATLVHEAVHVRERAYDRPHSGRDGELTSLTVQLEALKAMDAPESHARWIEEIIENIDDPAYQYWDHPVPPGTPVSR